MYRQTRGPCRPIDIALYAVHWRHCLQTLQNRFIRFFVAHIP
ncbi:hypothetical protein KUC_2484 [Vreelandella boliviensis LC1]|uniref:Uncharacterized protein n=1 Tax=Vreelandella boliviensis LC1 TaxID=1072583 RepID=A0A7U9BZY6_9GAMM|nr:hypothetical protein KUC_2484 [Halomonas boliviensis LC1]